MKVSDFQKCLRAMAELISTKAPAKELTEAADALAPFAAHTMAEFAAFLKLAEVKYRESGQLPDGKQPKAKAGKPSKPTAEELAAAIEGVRARLDRQEPLTSAAVLAELSRYEALTKAQLDQQAKALGYKDKPKTKTAALDMIVSRIMAGTIAAARTEV